MRISTPVLAVCGFVCAVSTIGALAPGRQAPASPSLQRPPDVPRPFSDPAAYVPSLDDLAAATSELRDVVARFNADRQAIQRFYTIPGSKERRARLRAFHEAHRDDEAFASRQTRPLIGSTGPWGRERSP